ncbi:hypothetical protein H6P81_002593 [Aristolochia fimbriata]|uniref:DUF7880 domain-containing protein n=1 Tax=Aristolochia fimbriata TaxID=158543 RepID=A0AAV7FA74_ARIFI|nr:hypothetical protein H6P81_002593 [Aristolochia fimbriata]
MTEIAMIFPRELLPCFCSVGMAAYPTHVSGFGRLSISCSPARSQTSRSKTSCRVRCDASSLKSTSVSRRSVSVAVFLFNWCCSNPRDANAGSILDKYVKRKKLDPLEAYVPVVLLSQSQFKDLGITLEEDQPKFADCRSLLRSGPASSLRTNIRAVAQYASDDGKGKTAFDAVDQCLRALEDLDSLLLRASRKDSGATVESMKTKVTVAVSALDSLLQTVPSEVLEKGRAIADAYNMPSSMDPEPRKPLESDPDLLQLESLL